MNNGMVIKELLNISSFLSLIIYHSPLFIILVLFFLHFLFVLADKKVEAACREDDGHQQHYNNKSDITNSWGLHALKLTQGRE
jgi:hypothetical protein